MGPQVPVTGFLRHCPPKADGKATKLKASQKTCLHHFIAELSGERLAGFIRFAGTLLLFFTFLFLFMIPLTRYIANMGRMAVVVILAGLITTYASAQAPDTLSPVNVTGTVRADTVLTTVLVQRFDKKEWIQFNSLSVADVVRFFAGTLVKDYGGIGGLKTVSVRSIGASHTGILYDGVPMSDAQGGQIDLGKISLDNLREVVLFNSQPPALLQPARAYASAAVLSLRTSGDQADSTSATAGIRAGSWGFFNPSLTLRHKANKHFSQSLNGEWQQADGSYRFDAYEQDGSRAKRNNTDIKALRAEYDATYRFNYTSRINFKAYYYSSHRGLPGEVILYNTRSRQRLEDQIFFAQAGWQKRIALKSRMAINAKYQYYYNRYTDPDFLNAQRFLENRFFQREGYLSAAYTYEFNHILSAAYASDFTFSSLRRSDAYTENFPSPDRHHFLNNATLKARWDRLDIQGNILHTYLQDRVKAGNTPRILRAYTPAIAASYQPVAAWPMRVRFFYKEIFRVPTFNDRYYTLVGNTNLRPEYVRQYNLGVAWASRDFSNRFTWSASVDAYYNYVRDKIVAVPRQNLFQWTMLNVGTADIRGIDAVLYGNKKWNEHWRTSVRLSYSYQRTLDITNPSSPLYKTPLPYAPAHSGSGNVSVYYGKYTLGYNLLLSSYRYRQGEPIRENMVEGFLIHDVSLARTFAYRGQQRIRAIAEVNNLFNTNYEVIRYYPMPGLQFRAGVSVDF